MAIHKTFAAGVTALGCGLAVAISLTGCGPEAMTLARQRALWEAHEPASYTYTLRINCFCPPEYTGPVRVEVLNGEPVSVTYIEDGEATAPDMFARYDTLDKIFDLIADACARGAYEISAEYDPEFGYPTSVYIDYLEYAIDEELGVVVSDSEVEEE